MINTHNIPMDIESLKAAAKCTVGLRGNNIMQITYDERTGKFNAYEHTDSNSYVEAFTVLRTRHRVTVQQLADKTAEAIALAEILRAPLA
nr:MAG TPA: hypothetical protein [Caudoviricetes sp.]